MNPNLVNSKWVALMGAVCAVLLLILAAEVLHANLQRRNLFDQPVQDTANAAQDAMPGIDLTQRTEDSFTDLVNRPLFIEGRKPVPEPSGTAIQAGVAALKFDWLLVGVYTTGNGLSALLTRAAKLPKDNYRKIRQDDELDGWKLTSLSKDRVLLMQGENQKELLLRKPKPKQLPSRKGAPPGAAVAPPEPETEQSPDTESESPEDTIENNDEEQF